MEYKNHAIDNDIFAHFRQEEQRRQDAITLLKKEGFVVYKRSENSPRIYETLGVSKKIVK
tara:strand:+ start:224 stop:403 length:180 start_codon:yes stop_codon:yes gene_type:complete